MNTATLPAGCAAGSAPKRTPHADTPMTSVPPGTLVGARRWPYAMSHPDAWAEPLVGEVLAPDDPAAWVGVAAFSSPPTVAAVRAHLARVAGDGLLLDRHWIPVRWAFGSVYWEPRARVRPVAEDRAAWHEARRAAYARQATRDGADAVTVPASR